MAQIRNLEYIRSKDPRLFEAFQDIIAQQNNVSQQINGNVTGQPQAPPNINKLEVTAGNGHFSAAITDLSTVYRGIGYFLEHADNPQFTNPQIIHLGATRNWTGFLGNCTRYFRAYSAYASSPPSAPVYHGGNAQPQPVTGGGGVPGPAFQASQGSGTGPQGVGLQGPGTIPYRTATGAPPIR